LTNKLSNNTHLSFTEITHDNKFIFQAENIPLSGEQTDTSKQNISDVQNEESSSDNDSNQSHNNLNLESKIQKISNEIDNSSEINSKKEEILNDKDNNNNNNNTNDQLDETIPWINGSVNEEIANSNNNDDNNTDRIEPKASNSNGVKKTKKQLEKEIIDFVLLKANKSFSKNELMSGIFANKSNKTRSKNRNVLDIEKVEEIKGILKNLILKYKLS